MDDYLTKLVAELLGIGVAIYLTDDQAKAKLLHTVMVTSQAVARTAGNLAIKAELAYRKEVIL